MTLIFNSIAVYLVFMAALVINPHTRTYKVHYG